MRRWILAAFVFQMTFCNPTTALAIWTREESLEWKTDISDYVLVSTAISATTPKPKNEYWDSQKVICKPAESLKGAYAQNIAIDHIIANPKNHWEGSTSAIKAGDCVLLFIRKTDGDELLPHDWINLSRPNQQAEAIASHTAYNNDCMLLADEKTIIAVVRAQVAKTSKLQGAKRRGAIVMFKHARNMYVDFVITAEPEYKKRFIDDLKSSYESTRCEAIYNLISYPGEDTIRAIRSMLDDPATNEIQNYSGMGETVVDFPVRHSTYLALRLLGEKIDHPVPNCAKCLPGHFRTGFEEHVYFPYGNWKRLEDIAAPPPAYPFKFIKGNEPVAESHSWRRFDYSYAVKADFAALRKIVEAELVPIGYKLKKEQANGYGRKWKSVEYANGENRVIMYEQMRYTLPDNGSPYSVVGQDEKGWVSFQVILERTIGKPKEHVAN